MEERYLSLSEAADSLDISERTAYRWIKSGKLRAYKPGRDYRIPEWAIRAAIEESEVAPKAGRSSLEPSFNDVLEGEQRRAELEEIRESYRETREGLDRYCDAWERRVAADDLNRLTVQGFLEAGDPLLPAMTDAVVSELIEISRVVGATEDGRVSKEMLAEASLKPVVDRYHTIGRRLQVIWREQFADTPPAEATGDNKVADFLAYKDAKLQAAVDKRAASG